MSTTSERDLIVIGGGIHGLVTAIRAGERGWRVMLVERDRIGSGATSGWLRILHGGLRYLQTLDVPRLRESVVSRRWFLRNHPDLIRAQRFLMPLYNQGLKRPGAFRGAFLVEALLAADRNRGVPVDRRLATGRVLGSDAVAELFPGARRPGLSGGALWEEAVVPDDTSLIGALTRQARDLGVTLHEGCAAQDLVEEGGAVRGLICRDRDSGATARVKAQVVINTAGAWSAALAEAFGGAPVFSGDTALAFNLLLDRPAPSEVGLSVQPPGGNGDMLFLYPDGQRCLAGTRYLPFEGTPGVRCPAPSAKHVAEFIEMLNAAIPGFEARPDDVAGVTYGLLPVTAPGTVALAKRDLIVDHGRVGGPRGLFSMRVIKYTTAPVLAQRVLNLAEVQR
ncbi:MAG: FAD-dependent oxidoreductase [Rhodobacteraceae bacterium]|nr:FAD-dependent oxidoreductase [Paracoccaceae bacterium]